MSNVVSEASLPGENNVIRVVELETGERQIYYRAELIDTLPPGEFSNLGLATMMENVVDYTVERLRMRWGEMNENVKNGVEDPYASDPGMILDKTTSTNGRMTPAEPGQESWWDRVKRKIS